MKKTYDEITQILAAEKVEDMLEELKNKPASHQDLIGIVTILVDEMILPLQAKVRRLEKAYCDYVERNSK